MSPNVQLAGQFEVALALYCSLQFPLPFGKCNSTLTHLSMLRVHNTIKCSWSGCFRCKSWKEQCGTREDSPGRNGLLASSSGCNLFSISMIQVSEWCSCTTNGIFAPSIKKKKSKYFTMDSKTALATSLNALFSRSSGLGSPGASMDSPKRVYRRRAAEHPAQWSGHPRPRICWTE